MKLPARIRLSLSNVILFLLIASPAILWVLDRTLVFEDRLLRDRYSPPPRILCTTLMRLGWEIQGILDDHMVDFLSSVRRNTNNIEFFIEKYQSLSYRMGWYANFCDLEVELLVPSMISCYISDDEQDTWWLGYNLAPPRLKGRFGSDRVSERVRESIERWVATRHPVPHTVLYGSSSIDRPPASADPAHWFTSQDTVAWLPMPSPIAPRSQDTRSK